MTLTEEQCTALRCAIAVLDGTAGGYTEREKKWSLSVLLEMLANNVPKQHAGTGSGK